MLVFILFVMCAVPVNAQENKSVYEQTIQDFTQENGIDFEQLTADPLGTLWEIAKKSIEKGMDNTPGMFARIAAVLVLTSFINLFAPQQSVQTMKLVNTVSVLVIFGNISGEFIGLVNDIGTSLSDVKNFMLTFIPVFAGVSFASGEMITSTVYTGFFLICITAVANFCVNYIIPSLNFFMAVGATSAVSSLINLKPLCDFYSKAVKTAMTAAVSVLCFMLSVQTTITQSQDSFALKTGKMIVTSAVPIIGSALQGAVGSVYASMAVLKGFFGIAGIAVVLGIFLPGIVRLILSWAGYFLMTVISGILENKAAGEILSCFKEVTEILLSMSVLFMVLLIFSLTIMIKVSQGG